MGKARKGPAGTVGLGVMGQGAEWLVGHGRDWCGSVMNSQESTVRREKRGILSPRRQRFVDEYLVDLNAKQA